MKPLTAEIDLYVKEWWERSVSSGVFFLLSVDNHNWEH